MAMRKPLVPEEAVRDFVLRQVGGVDEEAERAAREAALAQADEEAGMAMLQRGAAQVGSALSGAKVDEGFFNQMRADADRPLELYEKDRVARATKAKSDREMQQAASDYALKVLGMKRQEEKDAKDEDYRERRLAADEKRAANQARFQQLQLQAMAGDKEAQRQLLLTLKQMDLDARALEHEGRATDRLDRDVESLAKTMGPEMATLAQKVEAIATDIGGIDPTNRADIPGVGMVEGRLPSFLLSEQGQKVRQNARGVLAQLLKVQSGASVSEQELDRKMEELGMGNGSTEMQFRQGLNNLLREIKITAEQKQAGFKPDVVQEYQRRGGMTSTGFEGTRQKSQRPAASGMVKMRFPNGQVYPVPADKVDAARRKGGVEVPGG